MVHLSNLGVALADWWGYAEADRTIVGLLVVAVTAFAVGYVVMRALRRDGTSARRGVRRKGQRGRD